MFVHCGISRIRNLFYSWTFVHDTTSLLRSVQKLTFLKYQNPHHFLILFLIALFWFFLASFALQNFPFLSFCSCKFITHVTHHKKSFNFFFLRFFFFCIYFLFFLFLISTKKISNNNKKKENFPFPSLAHTKSIFFSFF